MKRTRIDLTDIAAFPNLVEAAVRAARGKRANPGVVRFFSNLEANVARLASDLLIGAAPSGHYYAFEIHDPKRRVIHAPCFEDRIVHHALIRLAGPRFEQTLTSSAYACRPDKGNLAAARAVHCNIRRFPWYVKIDIRAYFDSIDHYILKGLLARRFKGSGFFALIDRILQSYATRVGKGLPIGALTSQYFANHYLDGLDRFLLETLGVSAHIRYMDDSIWWTMDRGHAKQTLQMACEWLVRERGLALKGTGQINRSARGVTFCGFRVLPGAMRLTKRRQRRYLLRRRKWEADFAANRIDARRLQSAYAGVHAIVAHGDSRAWRQLCLSRESPPSL